MAIIFTPDLLSRAASSPPHGAPLLHRWARGEDDCAHAWRNQLERVAAAVPEDKRPVVLGQLLAKAAPDDQVRSTVGVVMLAKTFEDLGWQVVHEPEVDGKTPDLALSRGEATFFVEVRRIAERTGGLSRSALARVRDAVEGSDLPVSISVRSASVNGQASLRPFLRHVEDQAENGDEASDGHYFRDEGVSIGFDIVPSLPSLGPHVVSWNAGALYGGQHDRIRAAIDEKVSKYRFPHLVALDLYDPIDAFSDTEEVWLGSEGVRVTPGAAETIPCRVNDGILVRQDKQGHRVRDRLQGVLAFSLFAHESGERAVRARVFENPALGTPVDLAGFAPMPRLLVVERLADRATVSWLPSELADRQSWAHRP